MYTLEADNTKPIYEQIMDKVKSLVVSKKLKPNDKLPSLRDLSQQLEINPNTIQKAYQRLQGEGYLYASKRKGYFVAPLEQMPNHERLSEDVKPQVMNLLKEAIYLGLSRQELGKWYREAGKVGKTSRI